MPDATLTPVQPDASATLQGIAERYMANFPSLHTLARQAAGHIVRQQLGYWLDPDRIYWHRFEGAISSNRTFTGWRHEGSPVRSMTLSELTLRRFAAGEQGNSDLLGLYGGFYRVDGHHGRYDETNEVRLLPSAILQAFWNLDFQPVYLATLAKFWEDSGEDFCLLARTSYLAAVALAQAQGRLSERDYTQLCAAVAAGAALPLSLQQLRVKAAAETESPFRQCRLGAYTARDLFWLTLTGGRQVLYFCGQGRSELQVFDSTKRLNAWLQKQLRDPSARERFIAHFLHDAGALADDGATLRALCDQLVAATVHLERAGHPSRGDVFDTLYRVTVTEMVRDARARSTSNSELHKGEWMNYLKLAPRFVTPLALIWWPFAGVALGAGVGNLGLHLDQALNAPLLAQRRAGWGDAFVDVLFILIDAQMLHLGEVFEAPGLAEAPALASEEGYVPDSLRGVQDERPALALDEGGGEQAGDFPGRRSSFWDLHMQPSAEELLAVSDVALARQRGLMVHVPRVELEAFSADGDYLDAFGQPYPVYRDELGFGARNIKTYTHSPERYNNLLRGLALDGELAANVARVHGLADELESLGGDNQVRLYRVGMGRRDTSGAYWRDGRIKVGDRLLTTDFTSFSENPYFAWEMFNSPAAQVSGQAAFDDSSVIYVLEPGGARCAVPVAPFSDLQHEAESVVLPGWHLQVEDIAHISGADYRFVQVRLRAMEAGSGQVYELRTGQPFERERFAQRLGVVGASVMERFFLRY